VQDRRLPTQERVAAEIAAWEAERNAEKRSITSTFTTPTAQTKLAWLYPTIESATAS
jgi:hypothetical protein